MCGYRCIILFDVWLSGPEDCGTCTATCVVTDVLYIVWCLVVRSRGLRYVHSDMCGYRCIIYILFDVWLSGPEVCGTCTATCEVTDVLYIVWCMVVRSRGLRYVHSDMLLWQGLYGVWWLLPRVPRSMRLVLHSLSFTDRRHRSSWNHANLWSCTDYIRSMASISQIATKKWLSTIRCLFKFLAWIIQGWIHLYFSHLMYLIGFVSSVSHFWDEPQMLSHSGL